MHTIRTALRSFFYMTSSTKPAKSILDQISLLKNRGMLFQDEQQAEKVLSNISYYRLKGYWWDMQTDMTTHTFEKDAYFEDAVARYEFDRQLRLILFDAIELIEVFLRTKMVYHLSINYGGLWYKDPNLFSNKTSKMAKVIQTNHLHTLDGLEKEFSRSKEIFVEDHKSRFPDDDPEAWKILETASMGTLSKLYKGLLSQLPEKSKIANEMGLTFSKELSSWIESFSYMRNLVAHHSRLWERNMIIRPTYNIRNPTGSWFSNPLKQVQKLRSFLIISAMIYTCNFVTPGHHIKSKVLKLIKDNPSIPIFKIGFFNDWENEPIWRP